MKNELAPMNNAPPLPTPTRPPPQLAPPPMEPGKDVKLFMYRDPAGREFVAYTSKVSKGGNDVEKVKGKGGGVHITFPAALLLLALAACAFFLWTAKTARTATCDLCGAEVREWTDVQMTQEFDSVISAVGAAMKGGTIPATHFEICQGCYSRFKALMNATQSPNYDAILEAAGGG